MENEKQIKIDVPEGYVIDEENSTFKCIKFKKKESRFADYGGSYEMCGWYIAADSSMHFRGKTYNTSDGKNVYASGDAAKSVLAFAQLTQIRAHEYNRYGAIPVVSDTGIYAIFFDTLNELKVDSRHTACSVLETYLAFYTRANAELFLKENTQLVREYFMMS